MSNEEDLFKLKCSVCGVNCRKLGMSSEGKQIPFCYKHMGTNKEKMREYSMKHYYSDHGKLLRKISELKKLKVTLDDHEEIVNHLEQGGFDSLTEEERDEACIRREYDVKIFLNKVRRERDRFLRLTEEVEELNKHPNYPKNEVASKL